MRVILDVPDVLVQVSVDVGQLDDLGGVAPLEVLGDDLAEALLSLAFAVLEKILDFRIKKFYGSLKNLLNITNRLMSCYQALSS